MAAKGSRVYGYVCIRYFRLNVPSPFVDTDWLQEHLSSPDICVVDGSWYLPHMQRNAHEEFLGIHIPGAVYFDLDEIADTSTDLPHMVAAPQEFAKMVGNLGIRDTNTVIVYDSAGLFSAPRVWWNFKIMGLKNCFVLRGGLPKWIKENRQTSSDASMPLPRPFTAKPALRSIVGRGEIQSISGAKPASNQVQIVDLRPAMRFAGLQEEPRPGLRSGYMPNSINLPFTDLIVDGNLIGSQDIIKRLNEVGIDLNRPIIASCGSGVTAPILCLALAKIGIDAMRVYDGSWAEWAMQNNGPVIGADGALI